MVRVPSYQRWTHCLIWHRHFLVKAAPDSLTCSKHRAVSRVSRPVNPGTFPMLIFIPRYSTVALGRHSILRVDPSDFFSISSSPSR